MQKAALDALLELARADKGRGLNNDLFLEVVTSLVGHRRTLLSSDYFLDVVAVIHTGLPSQEVGDLQAFRSPGNKIWWSFVL